MTGETARGPVSVRTYGLCTLLRALCDQGFNRGADEIHRGCFEKGYLNVVRLAESRCEEGLAEFVGLCQFTFGIDRFGRNRWIDDILDMFSREGMLAYSRHGAESAIILRPESRQLLAARQEELAPQLSLTELEQREFLRLAHNGVLAYKSLESHALKRD